MPSQTVNWPALLEAAKAYMYGRDDVSRGPIVAVFDELGADAEETLRVRVGQVTFVPMRPQNRWFKEVGSEIAAVCSGWSAVDCVSAFTLLSTMLEQRRSLSRSSARAGARS